jgi:hypothetical protein
MVSDTLIYLFAGQYNHETRRDDHKIKHSKAKSVKTRGAQDKTRLQDYRQDQTTPV